MLDQTSSATKNGSGSFPLWIYEFWEEIHLGDSSLSKVFGVSHGVPGPKTEWMLENPHDNGWLGVKFHDKYGDLMVIFHGDFWCHWTINGDFLGNWGYILGHLHLNSKSVTGSWSFLTEWSESKHFGDDSSTAWKTIMFWFCKVYKWVDLKMEKTPATIWVF